METLGMNPYNQIPLSTPAFGLRVPGIESAFLKPGCFSDSDTDESSNESWGPNCSSEHHSDNSTKTSPPASESGFAGMDANYPRFEGPMGFGTQRENLMFDDLGHIFHPLNPTIARGAAHNMRRMSPRMSPQMSPQMSPRMGSPRMASPMASPKTHPRMEEMQRGRMKMRSRRHDMNHLTVPRNNPISRSISRSPSSSPFRGSSADSFSRSPSYSPSPAVNGRKIPEHRICKFFSNGYCNRGSGCNWAHVSIVPTRGCGSSSSNDNMANDCGNIASLKGNVYLLARQQEGCRMLQRYLEAENNSEAIEIIWREAIQHVGPLITDPFGHYLWLRLLDRITPKQRLELLKSLSSDMVGISLNVHGTRVVQKLLEKVKGKEEIEAAISALKGEISTLSKDVYGMHVVLRCLYHQGIDNAFIIQAVAKRIVSVSMHKHGCCVVQWCLDYGTRAQREGLIDQIAKNALELVQDAYGNYVVQQIMDVSKWKSHEDAAARRKVMKALLGNIAKLAVQKFSSIVVEKCLQEADDDIRMAMVEELVDPIRLPRLLQDPYANYVIQKVLSVSRSDEFQRLIVRIRPHLDVLSATPFGKRIQLQMFRKFPILSINGSRAIQAASQAGDMFSPYERRSDFEIPREMFEVQAQE